MSLATLRDALQAAAWTPSQRLFLEKLLTEVLPATLLGSSTVTVTEDERLGTLTFESVAEGRRVAFPLYVDVGSMTTTLTSGAGQATYRLPFPFVLEYVRASLHDASDTGPVVVDVNIGGASVFGTNKLSIDEGEKTSTTATTPADFTQAAYEDDAEILIDVDDEGVNASGLVVYLVGYPQTDAIERIQEDGVTRLLENGTIRLLEF